MKRSLRNFLFVIFIALGLFVGYGLTQQSLAQQTQNDNDSETNDDQEANDDEDSTSDGETNDDEMNDDEASLETSESEEMEGAEANQNPSAIESFGSVTLQAAVATAQAELSSSTPPLRRRLKRSTVNFSGCSIL
jgi:cobalamin biosynthesis protein CobT